MEAQGPVQFYNMPSVQFYNMPYITICHNIVLCMEGVGESRLFFVVKLICKIDSIMPFSTACRSHQDNGNMKLTARTVQLGTI